MERRWILRVAALAATAAAGAGAAYAAAGGAADSDAVLHACSRPGGGQLRLVAAGTPCRRREIAVAWNVAGPAGAAGPAGTAGPAGPAGPRGEAGPGLTSLEQLDGVACAAGGGGTIDVSYDAAGDAVLACSGAATTTTTTTTTATTATTTTGTTTGAGPAAVKVNEFATGTTGAAGDEFVELVNAGTVTADLSGWKLVYRSATGTADVTLATLPDGTTLAAGGHYLLGGSAYAGSAPADRSFSFGLAAAGGGIGLRDNSGTLVDSVGYGSATNAFVEGSPAPAPPAADAPGSSAARSPDAADSGDNSADFVVAAPTPRAGNG